nr:hypothetical protein [Commensalibacter intestini]
MGYPHADTNRCVITQQNCSIGARIYTGPSKTKHIVINNFARPGQSGSPILSKDRLKIHAILLGAYIPKTTASIDIMGVNPLTLHQTTHAVSAEYIQEMI